MEMEPWAHRIYARMVELGLNQSELAKACGIKEPSVSGWFGKGSRPTRMISGDNLVFAAKALKVTPEWIITGKGAAEAAIQSQSHPLKLDPTIVASTHQALTNMYRDKGRIYHQEDAARFVLVYERYAARRPGMTEAELIQFGTQLPDVMAPQGATEDGRSDGVPNPGTDKRAMARRVRRKA